MPELVLYGIRLLAMQFLGTFLDIEVDDSAEIFSSSIKFQKVALNSAPAVGRS